MNENQVTIQSYEQNPDDYISLRSQDEQEKFSAWIVGELVKFKKKVKIFEIGSGPGYLADYLESLDYVVTRSDVVDKFIEFNAERGKQMLKYDVVKDEFPEKFDAVIAINVMQHMNKNDMVASLKNIQKGIEPGGVFLFTITLGDGNEWHDDKGGSRYFELWNEADLSETLSANGFDAVSITPIGYKNWVNVVTQAVVFLGSSS